MGAILGKIWRRKKSTKEVLEKIRDDINDIEEFKQSTQAWHKKLIGCLLAYFSVLYLVAALVAYFKYFNNPRWNDFSSQLQLLTPFIIAPFILIFIKRFLTWWYHRKIKNNEVALEKLKKQKAKILDEVMETETYKVAKEILDEFASDQEKRALNLIRSPAPQPGLSKNKTMMETPTKAPLVPNAQASELRRRNTTQTVARSTSLISSRPNNPNTSTALGASFVQENKNDKSTESSPIKLQRPGPNVSRMIQNTSVVGRSAPGPPLPRPVLPRERGYMDRVVEYLVGDGPNNRYALICRQCQSHNGMALREEFEYIAYRCCYCHYWNPARKQRPTAPKLEPSTLKPQISTESSSDDEDSESRPLKGQSHSKTTNNTSETKSETNKLEAEKKSSSKSDLTEEVPSENEKPSDTKKEN